jgi:8-oxo-dGTP pyrophosphatase MutT (NUDIX family)
MQNNAVAGCVDAGAGGDGSVDAGASSIGAGSATNSATNSANAITPTITPPHTHPQNGKKHVVSYGVLCCRKNPRTQRIEALMVSKRYTYEYCEFISGKPFTIGKKIPIAKLTYMLNRMTLDEKLDIISFNFDQMWYRICLSATKTSLYYHAKNKFEQIFLVDRGAWLASLILKSNHAGVIWEIPKGRKNTQESGINCAVREFYEETNIEKKQYNILPNIYRSYTFEDAGVIYTFMYYIAITHRDITPKINIKNRHQVAEISNVKWMDLDTIGAVDGNNRLRGFLTPIFAMVKKQLKM